MNTFETPATTTAPQTQPVVNPNPIPTPTKPEGYVMRSSTISVSPQRPFRSIAIFIYTGILFTPLT